MIKHPPVNTLNLKIYKRASKHTLEWGGFFLNLMHLKSFKRGEGEQNNSIILTFPYSEVELPCTNHSIMLLVLDELQIYLDSMNVVSVPQEGEKEEKVIPPVVTPTQMIKLGNKKFISLIGLKEIVAEGPQISLYYEQTSEVKSYKAENAKEALLIVEKAQEHINKMQLLRIFKNLQSNNPFCRPEELWKTAEETQSLLVEKNINLFY